MHSMETPEKYRHCLVLAGGGFRFGYYLGVHAAAEETGNAPDIVLASCGGAIAAAIIQALPDAAARRAWAASPAMYRFLCAVQPTPYAAPRRALADMARRWLARVPVATVPDLFNDYLFDVPAALPLPPPAASGPALAIVGGRLLFRPHEAGTARAGRQLYEEIVFGPARAAALLDGLPAPAADSRWSCGAVAPLLATDSAMPVADAVRISVADMFYFRSHQHQGRDYTGGVIDLFPIELAQRLARRVTMERKAPFHPHLALPALRTVLGIDGAARLQHVHAQHADAWVDTSDVGTALRKHGIGKRIDWLRNRIALAMPPTLPAYAAQVEAQWQYGYRKALAAFGTAGSMACA
jgi:predicted acylesterase/phospholipase RssA